MYSRWLNQSSHRGVVSIMGVAIAMLKGEDMDPMELPTPKVMSMFRPRASPAPVLTQSNPLFGRGNGGHQQLGEQYATQDDELQWQCRQQAIQGSH